MQVDSAALVATLSSMRQLTQLVLSCVKSPVRGLPVFPTAEGAFLSLAQLRLER